MAWILKLPSILLLLILGLVAGPVTGFIVPDAIFGPALFPFVSLSVAIILFEGGLSLKLAEYERIGGVVRRLATFGVCLTWLLSAVAAHTILDFSISLSILSGALLVVTGPTVIIPLIRHIQPVSRVGAALRWEGIVTDPIGAILAVLVYEAMLTGGLEHLPSVALVGIFKTVVVASVIAFVAIAILITLVRRHLLPDFLESPMALALVIGAFVLSNHFQEESGLLTTTLMGFILANQHIIPVRRILEFKETLRSLLIASLFIVLAARLRIEDLSRMSGDGILFLAALIFVVRPLAIFFSTLGSAELSFRERIFLALVCPRGVVAVAVASLFGIGLAQAEVPRASDFATMMFLVVLGTVAVYSIAAPPLAKLLGVSRPRGRGLLIAGADEWIRRFAKLLLSNGAAVILVDTNRENIAAAQQAGIPAVHGSILDHDILDAPSLDEVDGFLAATTNDEVNTLAALQLMTIFGHDRVFRVRAAWGIESAKGEKKSLQTEVPLAFAEGMTVRRLLREGGGDDGLQVVQVPAEVDDDEPIPVANERILAGFLRSGGLVLHRHGAKLLYPQLATLIVLRERPAKPS